MSCIFAFLAQETGIDFFYNGIDTCQALLHVKPPYSSVLWVGFLLSLFYRWKNFTDEESGFEKLNDMPEFAQL